MRPITRSQWQKAPLRTKSWLLCKSLGFPFSVYWHLTKDGTHAGICSGSYESLDYAEGMIEAWRSIHPLEPIPTIRRDLAFWWCAEHVNPSRSVIEAMLKMGFTCHLLFMPQAPFPGDCTFLKDGGTFNFQDSTMELAICGAALYAMGLLKP